MRSFLRFTLTCGCALAAVFCSASELIVGNYFGNNITRYDSGTGALLGTYTGGSLQGPLGMAIGPDGLLYVCSETNNSIQRFSTTTHAYVDTFVSGVGLDHPTGISWDKSGNAYVSNFESSSISKYSASGAFISTLVPTGTGGLDGPDLGTTIGPDGKLYVPSFNNNKVLRFDSETGALIDVFVAPGLGGMSQPRTILWRNDMVWISCDNGNRVVRYSLTGGYKDTFVTTGSGTLNGAVGMALTDGYLFVASWRNNRINRYASANGAFLSSITAGLNGPTSILSVPTPGSSPSQDLFVSSSGTNSIKRYDGSTGSYIGDFVAPGAGGLSNPQGITFGPDGNLYVSCPGKGVLKYNGQTGAFIGTFTTGTTLTYPGDLTFRPDGYLYVSDFIASGTVKRFYALTGVYKDTFVTGINKPDGQSWDLSGNFYLSCFGNNQVKKYNGVTGAQISNFATTGSLSGPAESRFGQDGNLYVCSFNTGSIKRYNGSSGAFIGDFVTGIGQTVGQAIGPDGLLYLSSQTADTISRYNPTTGASMGVFASGGGLNNPTNFCFGPSRNASFTGSAVPTTLTAGMHNSVSLTFRNDGTTVWSSMAGDFLKPFDLLWGLDRFDLGQYETIEPGRDKVWNLNLLAPEEPGTYTLRMGMSNAFSGDFGVASDEITVNVVRADKAAQFISQVPTPPTMVAGTTAPISITMRNVGSATWRQEDLIGLGSRNPVDNYLWGFTRIFMAAGDTCPPGSNYTFSRTVTAPWAAGTYNYQWKPIQTGIGWFGELTEPVRVVVTAAPNAATFVSQVVPTSVAAGATFNASVTFKNTGTNTWTNAKNYKLGSYGPINNTNWGINRWDMPANSNVAPNGQVTFTRTFTAPTTPGTYTFQWRMIQSGVAFFGEVPRAVTVTVTGAGNSAEFVSQDVPETVSAGQTFSASLVFRNSGTNTWSDANGYRLASINPSNNTTWGVNRIFLGSDTVAPGAQYTFSKTFTAPTTPGTYVFQWKMLQNGVGTFAAESPAVTITVTAQQNASVVVDLSVPSELAPGEQFTASVTMKNIGSAAWSDAEGYRLASYDPPNNTTWGANRVFLGDDVVDPGEEYTFSRTFRAPEEPGTYEFQWKMLQNGAGTFGVPTPIIAVTVG